jgi:hypothetical protein
MTTTGNTEATMSKTERDVVELIAKRCAIRIRNGERFSREMALGEMRAELALEEEIVAQRTERSRNLLELMARNLWTEARASG